MKVQTPIGPVLICKVYNPCKANTPLPHILALLKAHRGHAIFLGNFNQHRPDWDESPNAHLFTSATLDLAQPLLNIIIDTPLVMALPKDLPTLQSTLSKNYTQPDNVFASTRLAETLISCNIMPSSRPPCTNHFPITTIVNLSITEAPSVIKPNFKKANWTLSNRHSREA
ncbi:hypothetical protein RSOLAG1IB_10843 [Rhizoctonia solani AG-1 IB]|uniref:Endonuclease/exonuclease/phosphatase domain-containing protein n=1 Tax=Thanatephorus cucumeris (strain AG1-IB / isolate 7/3/14) TaxID=1108050 RepID=M5BWR1_THACB|nr:hypothetical protein BN14_05637 [Rhizoctonia solani AG-1 IB]CEL63542.1 hypothetical protein RSOLAG1IB_10843 [Rhizoctonia solani AG-1 IB]